MKFYSLVHAVFYLISFSTSIAYSVNNSNAASDSSQENTLKTIITQPKKKQVLIETTQHQQKQALIIVTTQPKDNHKDAKPKKNMDFERACGAAIASIALAGLGGCNIWCVRKAAELAQTGYATPGTCEYLLQNTCCCYGCAMPQTIMGMSPCFFGSALCAGLCCLFCTAGVLDKAYCTKPDPRPHPTRPTLHEH